MKDFVFEVLLDGLKDSALLFPFLYLTYLLMEFIEHRAGDRMTKFVGRAGRVGPLFGGLLGGVPQCGFSAAAASLYAGRVITAGTLIAVFLATSDEMVAVMLSGAVENSGMIIKLFKVLGIKVICGILVGFLVDLVLRKRAVAQSDSSDIGDICDHDHCNCGHESIFLSALRHAVKIWLFILAVTVALNAIMFFIGEDRLKSLGTVIKSVPVIGEFIAGLVGLIPNCASSVVITELYVEGIISAGQLLAGLFTGAGVGVLILFRANRRNMKENLMILLVLYLSGVALGLLFGLTGLASLIGI